jgi:hypothetical protein
MAVACRGRSARLLAFGIRLGQVGLAHVFDRQLRGGETWTADGGLGS